MKKGKLKRIQKVISTILSVVFLVSVPMLEVNAAEQYPSFNGEVEIMESAVGEVPAGYFEQSKNARAALSDCIISVGFGSEGMDIEILTSTNAIVPVVGVKDIRVEQKMWYGWKLVAVSNGAQVTDSDGIAVHVVFTGAIKGKTYHVTCIHYADLVDDGIEEFTEGFADTGDFIFTY